MIQRLCHAASEATRKDLIGRSRRYLRARAAADIEVIASEAIIAVPGRALH